MMHKLLLILLLFHGLEKAQSARLNLRLAACLTSRTALLLTYLSYSTGSQNYAVTYCLSKLSQITAQPIPPSPYSWWVSPLSISAPPGSLSPFKLVPNSTTENPLLPSTTGSPLHAHYQLNSGQTFASKKTFPNIRKDWSQRIVVLFRQI